MVFEGEWGSSFSVLSFVSLCSLLEFKIALKFFLQQNCWLINVSLEWILALGNKYLGICANESSNEKFLVNTNALSNTDAMLVS